MACVAIGFLVLCLLAGIAGGTFWVWLATSQPKTYRECVEMEADDPPG